MEEENESCLIINSKCIVHEILFGFIIFIDSFQKVSIDIEMEERKNISYLDIHSFWKSIYLNFSFFDQDSENLELKKALRDYLDVLFSYINNNRR